MPESSSDGAVGKFSARDLGGESAECGGRCGTSEKAIRTTAEHIEAGEAANIADPTCSEAFEEATALRNGEGAADDGVRRHREGFSSKTLSGNDGMQEVSHRTPCTERDERCGHGEEGISNGPSCRQCQGTRRGDTRLRPEGARGDLEDRPADLRVEDRLEHLPDELEDRLEHIADRLEQTGQEEARRIRERQRVVVHVRVDVVRLQVREVLDGDVGGQEPPDLGVVDAPVHVDQADRVELLVEGVAARDRLALPRIGRRGRVDLPVERAPLAPGVEAQALDDGAGRVRDHVDRAEMVGQQVLDLAGPDAGRGRGVDDDRNARDRQLEHGLARGGHRLVGAAGHIVRGARAGLVDVDALEARAVGPVLRLDLRAAVAWRCTSTFRRRRKFVASSNVSKSVQLPDSEYQLFATLSQKSSGNTSARSH